MYHLLLLLKSSGSEEPPLTEPLQLEYLQCLYCIKPSLNKFKTTYCHIFKTEYNIMPHLGLCSDFRMVGTFLSADSLSSALLVRPSKGGEEEEGRIIFKFFR